MYAYVESLNQDTKEAEQLFRDLLISVTHFFRDPEVFDLLATRVIPRLFEGKDSDGSVRVWVPGCATGEEAYSIAMLLREHMDTLETPPQVQVFATDIDAQAIETARQALYPETIAGQIPPERLERFFVKHGNMLQVSREIRDLCLFSLHNLIADPPFSRLDLVSCRQPPDLSGERSPEEGHRPVPLRPAPGRDSPARSLGDGRHGALPHDRQEAPSLPVARHGDPAAVLVSR